MPVNFGRISKLFLWIGVYMGTVSTTATPTSGHTTHLQFEYSPDQINSICQKQIEILKGKIEKIAQLKPNEIGRAHV